MLAFTFLSILLLPAVGAHAPEFPGNNESLRDAKEVQDPTKSWAIYSELHEGGGGQYYLLPMKRGENISVSMIIPKADAERGFLPSMALMGPGISASDPLPNIVETINESGTRLEIGALPGKLTYEPFSPSAFYEIGEISLNAPQDGNYYLAVFDNATGGHYGLAVGQRESFTADEWLLVPFSDLIIYQWEGQVPLVILAPIVLTFLVGLAVMTAASRRRSQSIDVLWVLATVSGLVMVASGISLIYQMLLALSQTGADPTLVVTIIFAVIPLALGSASLRIAHRDRSLGGIRLRIRLTFIVISGLGLLFWAGWIVGPALAFICGILPSRWLLKKMTRRQ